MTNVFYQLKISLLHIQPEIWRSFEVPSNITLDRLHDVIQMVMGWTDSHLHEYTINKKKYTEYPQSEEDGIEEGQFRLSDLIKRKGQKFTYLYDFGDYWEHSIVLESKSKRTELNDAFKPILRCLDGARSCPPEDVGGIPGYMNLCESMSNKDHPEYENNIEWLGEVYDPERIDLDEINLELFKYERWSRDRYHSW
tara:strand:- start:314 stop:901 length:588 start_codon:yes stop_codon:yes gene_type:complete